MKQSLRICLALVALFLFSATASAQKTHSVWSYKPQSLVDKRIQKTFDTFTGGNGAITWTDGTVRGHAHIRVVVDPNFTYDFFLVGVSRFNSADEIWGYWRIRRNGVVICKHCTGRVRGLSGPVNDSFTIQINDQPIGYRTHIPITPPAIYTWSYTATITARFDF